MYFRMADPATPDSFKVGEIAEDTIGFQTDILAALEDIVQGLHCFNPSLLAIKAEIGT